MAKDNVMTGKTETVGSIGSNKVSGFGLGLLKGLKPSKFVKPEEKKENTVNWYFFINKLLFIITLLFFLSFPKRKVIYLNLLT